MDVEPRTIPTPHMDHRAGVARILVWLSALVVLGLLGAGLSACGGASKDGTASEHANGDATQSTTTSSAPVKFDADHDTDGTDPDEDDSAKPLSLDRDHDTDSNGKSRYDSDDENVLNFGHAPSALDRLAIARIVRRYYKVAVAEDGSKACTMLYSTYAEAVPEDYGTSPPGPYYARGATCPAVMTLVFKHFHDQLASRLPLLQVSRVRIKEHQGVAILSFGTRAEREIRLEREGPNWKILALIDNELR